MARAHIKRQQVREAVVLALPVIIKINLAKPDAKVVTQDITKIIGENNRVKVV